MYVSMKTNSIFCFENCKLKKFKIRVLTIRNLKLNIWRHTEELGKNYVDSNFRHFAVKGALKCQQNDENTEIKTSSCIHEMCALNG